MQIICGCSMEVRALVGNQAAKVGVEVGNGAAGRIRIGRRLGYRRIGRRRGAKLNELVGGRASLTRFAGIPGLK